MPDDDINDARLRYRVLRHLCSHNDLHPFVSMEKDELVKELNLDENELQRYVKFLEDNMLLETVWFMGGDFWTKISQDGIDEIFRIEMEPERETKYFPSFQRLHFG